MENVTKTDELVCKMCNKNKITQHEKEVLNGMCSGCRAKWMRTANEHDGK